jgi:hypothetical protein
VDIGKKKKCQQQLASSFMIVKIVKKYYALKREIAVYSVRMARWLAHLFNKTKIAAIIRKHIRAYKKALIMESGLFLLSPN